MELIKILLIFVTPGIVAVIATGRAWRKFAWYAGTVILGIVSLTRRLERLEMELAPISDKPALTILLTSVGQPDHIIEVHRTAPPDLRRRRSPPRRVVEDSK